MKKSELRAVIREVIKEKWDKEVIAEASIENQLQNGSFVIFKHTASGKKLGGNVVRIPSKKNFPDNNYRYDVRPTPGSGWAGIVSFTKRPIYPDEQSFKDIISVENA